MPPLASWGGAMAPWAPLKSATAKSTADMTVSVKTLSNLRTDDSFKTVWKMADSLLPATALRVCSRTGNYRSAWFIFGSESSSSRRFLGITHSFKLTRKRLKCLENAFPAVNFSEFSGGGRPAPRTSTQSCRESMPVPPNRFNPVRLCP